MSGLVLAHRLPGMRAGTPGGAARATTEVPASRLAGPASIVAASASLQGSAALATSLFVSIGAAGTSSLRFLAGAVVLLALARPRLRGRRPRAWAHLVAFGAATAAANVCLFEAIARVSLGTAATLQFLGPLAVALIASRRRLDLACAAAGASGIVLLTGGPSQGSLLGLGFGVGAGACVAVSIVFSERVARETAGLEGLALAVAAAAVLTLPVSASAIDGLDVSRIPTVAAVGVLGIAIPYALFLHAIRHVGAKTYSILLSLDPAVAVVAGLLVLGQSPDVGAVFGIGLVVAASAVAVGTRGPR